MRNRKRHFASEEADERRKKVIEALKTYPNKSLREVANMTGTTKDVVSRIKKSLVHSCNDNVNAIDTIRNSIYCPSLETTACGT